MLRHSDGTMPSELRKNRIVSVDMSRGSSCFGYVYTASSVEKAASVMK